MRMRLVVPLLLLAVGAIAALALLAQAPPAQAGLDFEKASLTDLGKVVTSDKPTNLRLVALEALRKKSGAESELYAIARSGDVETAVFATTALGKVKSEAAKTRLKALLSDSKVKKQVRKSAMTAIAVHFKNPDDQSYLWSMAQDDGELKAHYNWLKTYVYGQ